MATPPRYPIYLRIAITQSAVAYTRVSTKKQGSQGIGLAGQLVAIRKFAEQSGIQITQEFRDVGTGRGETSFDKRQGLQDAISVAKAEGVPILVSSLDRLSRHTGTVQKIIREGVAILSVAEGLLNDAVVVASVAARAEYAGRQISERTKKTLAEKKRDGVLLGNRTNLPLAQKRGAARNRSRSLAKSQEIADALSLVDDIDHMTASDVARELNARGILTGRHRPWTTAALRRPLREAKEILQRRADADRKAERDNPDYGMF